ncbi:hypothetical protein O181_080841 [Austropuccinia psidii MF-1]|uniref:Uncharacterized protein n=1 Tax=Austropuccinia psidii MF-1 TaxID=1389203 RepID=A0A9Q3FIZ4_9BASI|nr:hypothetical protein [Austropuccinia psidii MF-1]
MLIGTIHGFIRTRHFPEASPEIKIIIDAVTTDHILKHWWLNDSLSSLQQKSVKQWILRLVTFFGRTGDSNKPLEYLISYYLLNFIKTFQTSHSPTIPLCDLEQTPLFDTKYELFQAGIRLHEVVNRSFDYKHLVELPSDQRDYLATDITAEMVEYSKMEIIRKQKEYEFIKANIAELGQKDESLCTWIKKNYFLKIYDTLLSTKERRNLWPDR